MASADDSRPSYSAPGSGTVTDTSTRASLAAEGRRHESEGDLLTAIECLAAANRVERDADIERRLVELRVRGASALPPTTARAPWPPPLDDPFPGAEGLPETTPDELDETVVGGAILHHGALLVRGLATPDEAAALGSGVDRALLASADDQRDGEWYSPVPVEGDSALLHMNRHFVQSLHGLLLVDSPRLFTMVHDVLTRLGLLSVLESYFGEQPVLSVDKTTVRTIPESINPTWHQDGSFMGDVRAVNLWLALSHCGADTGVVGLDLVPERVPIILETGADDAPEANVSISQGMVDRSTTQATVTPEFWAGDALLFDERFIHRTSERPSPAGDRRALEAWFFARSHFPPLYRQVAV